MTFRLRRNVLNTHQQVAPFSPLFYTKVNRRAESLPGAGVQCGTSEDTNWNRKKKQDRKKPLRPDRSDQDKLDRSKKHFREKKRQNVPLSSNSVHHQIRIRRLQFGFFRSTRQKNTPGDDLKHLNFPLNTLSLYHSCFTFKLCLYCSFVFMKHLEVPSSIKWLYGSSHCPRTPPTISSSTCLYFPPLLRSSAETHVQFIVFQRPLSTPVGSTAVWLITGWTPSPPSLSSAGLV